MIDQLFSVGVCHSHGYRHRYEEGKIEYENKELEGNTVFLHSTLHQKFLCYRHHIR
jgi:hypothetical protein